MLSEQYSQKCLENAHLAQALEAERQALRQCQRENQELNAHNQVRVHTPTLALTILRSSMANVFFQHSASSSTLRLYALLKLLCVCNMLQELNNRLAAEITRMRSMTSEDGVGDSGTTIQGKELYELEVRGAAAAVKILFRTISVNVF